jgi:hypothetical protein
MQEDRGATDDFDPYADDPLFTAEQAAEYCKISVTKINDLRRERKLPHIRTISDARYRRSDLNKLNNNHVSWGWMGLK